MRESAPERNTASLALSDGPPTDWTDQGVTNIDELLLQNYKNAEVMRLLARLALRGFYIAIFIMLISVAPEKSGAKVCAVLLSVLLSAVWTLDEYYHMARISSTYSIAVDEASKRLSSIAIRYSNSTNIKHRNLLPIDPWILEPAVWLMAFAATAVII